MAMEPAFRLPPGPKGLPVVGNSLQFSRDPLRFMRETQKTYGRIATMYIGKQPLVLFFRPEHVRYVLTENQKNFVKPNRGGGANLRYILGDGLLTIDGEYHRQQRRLVQPAFHKRRVEGYADIMVQFTEEMLGQWRPGMTLNMASAMQQLTLSIIGKTLFNIDAPPLIAELGAAFNAVINNGRSLASRNLLRANLPFTRYGKVVAGKRTLDEFVYNLIAERREDGRDMGDVLSMLLHAQEEGDTLSDKQVHDHVLTFVAAGHETAQNTLSWTFYLLSQHPDKREKLLNELQTVLAGRSPTVADLAHLPYLEWVINESWRILPPAWIQGRRAVNDFELDGYHFPAGTIGMISQWVTHNLPDIWGDPEVYRPERWDPVEGEKVPQWAYFPFGGGSRICIGMPFAEMETKLLLATILQRYAPRLEPGFPVVPKPRVTLRPKYGMRMILEPVERPAVVSVS